ncbi:Hypothetical protein CAP_3252 [Chondromyces apiculatus DSM 436]|uniref:Uncharacterized protein n=1 Tax=Chondromyces apiculatus DSM 436 TaxID=1192034 RepID=A0A017T940_9BACT|nr:Hypothetical protein CAP_3252 [Chondromyces apiculatus DSM 436]
MNVDPRALTRSHLLVTAVRLSLNVNAVRVGAKGVRSAEKIVP